jgi:pyruvate formate lyase activating enzyme
VDKLDSIALVPGGHAFRSRTQERDAMSVSGMVFNIQRFCLHDGPGVRTVLFLKGCPLRCAWCSNPESWRKDVELMHDTALCIGCGQCIAVCPQAALGWSPRPLARDEDAGENERDAGTYRIMVDRQRCTVCGLCSDLCPSGAMHRSGRSMTVADVLEILLADRNYYETSGGGVTFSGGEPLLQSDFIIALARALAAEGIGCVIETSGFCDSSTLAQVIAMMDHVLFDVKMMDRESHLTWTGVDNVLILQNLDLAAAMKPTTVRIPLVPTVNLHDGAWDALFERLQNCPIQAVHLLPYHAWGSGKTAQLGNSRAWRTDPASAEQLAGIRRLFTEKLKVPVLLL